MKSIFWLLLSQSLQTMTKILAGMRLGAVRDRWRPATPCSISGRENAQFKDLARDTPAYSLLRSLINPVLEKWSSNKRATSALLYHTVNKRDAQAGWTNSPVNGRPLNYSQQSKSPFSLRRSPHCTHSKLKNLALRYSTDQSATRLRG